MEELESLLENEMDLLWYPGEGVFVGFILPAPALIIDDGAYTHRFGFGQYRTYSVERNAPKRLPPEQVFECLPHPYEQLSVDYAPPPARLYLAPRLSLFPHPHGL